MTVQNTLTIDHKKLFQSLSNAYIVYGVDDPDFTILEENQAHAEISMVKRDDIIGKSVFDVFPDVSEQYLKTGVSLFKESVRKVIRTKRPDMMPNLKYDLVDKKGNVTQKVWSLVHYPVFDKENNVIAVCQSTEDVTDKVQTEKKLNIAQAQLEQTLSNGSIGTWFWDIKLDKVYGDSNLAMLFGLPADQVKKGMAASMFIGSIHPADRDRVANEIQGAIKTTGSFESEYRTFNTDGDVRWVLVRGKIEADEAGNMDNFPGVIVDITDRKTAENNIKFLTAASTQFSASLDPKVTLSTIAGMVVPDIADWCSIDLFDGKTIERVATAHKDPAKVKWAKELYEKQGPPNLNEPSGLPNVLRTGEVEYYPDIPDEMLVAVAKDEDELKLMREVGFSSVIIVPMKLDNKTIGAISLISTESKIHYKPSDIEVAKGLANRAALAVYNANLYQAAQHELKERKLLQRQLEAANNVLESRVVERTRQLVDTNDGLEKEIRRRQKTERELQEYGKNLARSNQELQDFAYVASHDLQEPLRKIQAFGDLLESEYKDQIGDGKEYLNRMRSAASRMSILIQDLLAFSRVTTKPQQIDQVDLNVIVKEVIGDLETSISEKDGKVSMAKLPAVWADATHMRQLFQNLIGNALKFHKEGTPPKVAISLKSRAKDDKYYEIHVKDNGIGFDEKYLDRIFSVFQRLHGRDAYEGTGIGLAVCRKIVERYGGKIEAKSKQNSGSTFIIKLPINHKERPHDHM
ncbi:MAG: domain S-box protein [Candidatus Saccharibacteria bacterium]|jgi:PAS domain S-box-containing protein|nr:domain S-box protein [Candidatus Saccharibacteria bacterium]